MSITDLFVFFCTLVSFSNLKNIITVNACSKLDLFRGYVDCGSASCFLP